MDRIRGGSPLDEPGLYADLLNAALAEVDWLGIAEKILEDLGPAGYAVPKFPLGGLDHRFGRLRKSVDV